MSESKAKKSNKKEAILETAKVIFSQKGYDGTSMDEIALKTNVPKSLIYYHFKSKEELLYGIIIKFFKEYEMMLSDENGFDESRYLKFIEDNSDFLRVIIMESLKKNSSSAYMFKLVELLMRFESKVTNNKELAEYSLAHERWVTEFFTSIVPSVLFACYKEQWCQHFNTDKGTLEQDFLYAYNQTHVAYHRNMLEKENI